MTIGALRHRLAIQDKVITRTPSGEAITTWVTRMTVWGSVEPLKGTWFFRAQEMNQNISGRITMRYLANLNTNQRIMFGDRIFRIISVINEDERRRWIHVFYEEVLTSD